MSWKNRTLSDIRRLLATLERSDPNRDVVQAIINQTPDKLMPYGRVTLGTICTLLDQLDGSTVLPDEVVAMLRQPPVTAAEPATTNQPPATFNQLIAACKFTSVENGFTEENFPLADDNTTQPVVELPFNNVSGQTAARYVAKRGLQPLGLRRALEYIAQNRDQIIHQQKNIAIIGAVHNGSSPTYKGSSPVVVVNKNGSFVLALLYFSGVYPNKYHYLATAQ